MQLHGLDIKIEYPKGTTRSGVGPTGQRWSQIMPCSYGAIKRTRAADGEQVDAYIGPDRDSGKVFVLDQLNAETKRYDEAKVLLGFKSKDEAIRTYSRAFSDGRARDRIGSVTELSPDKFCAWLANPANTKKPLGNLKGYAAGGIVTHDGSTSIPEDWIPKDPPPYSLETDIANAVRLPVVPDLGMRSATIPADLLYDRRLESQPHSVPGRLQEKPLAWRPEFSAGGKTSMPLIKSGSKTAISKNIAEMSKTRPRDQAIAAALDTARRYAHKASGGPVGMAEGGDAKSKEVADYVERTYQRPDMPWYLPESAVGDKAYRHQGVALHGLLAALSALTGRAGMKVGRSIKPDIAIGGYNAGYIPYTIGTGRTAPRPDLGPLEPLPEAPYAQGGNVPGYDSGGMTPSAVAPLPLPKVPRSVDPNYEVEGPSYNSPIEALGGDHAIKARGDETRAFLDTLAKTLWRPQGDKMRERAKMGLGEQASDMGSNLYEAGKNSAVTAAEMSGVPSMYRGVGKIIDPDSDNWTKAQGVGETVLGAVPGLGMVGRTAPIARGLAGTFPRLTGLGVAASDAPRKLADAFIGEAQASDTRGDIHPPDFPDPRRAGKPLTKLELEQRQQEMIDKGVYKGKADGRWESGSQSAWETLQKREQDEKDKIKRETDRMNAGTRASEAGAKKAEEDRKTAEAEAKKAKDAADALAQKRKEVDDKTKDLEKARGVFTKALYAAPEVVGAVGGGLLGKGIGYALGLPFGAAAKRTQTQVNDIIAGMPEKFTAATRPKIAGAVNDVWTRGGGTEPFSINPKAVPPFKFNKESPPPGELYPKKGALQGAIQTGIGAAPLYEAYKSWHNADAVNKELREAEVAFNDAPTDVNAKRYEDARNDAAWNRALLSGSVGYTAGHLFGAGFNAVNRDAYRPKVGEADAARLRLQTWLGTEAEKAAAAKAAKLVAQAGKGRNPPGGAKKKGAPSRNGATPLLPLAALPLAGEGREDSRPSLGLPSLSSISHEEPPYADGGEVKHHSNYQPRYQRGDRRGKFKVGGPVFPNSEPAKEPLTPKSGFSGAISRALDTARKYAKGGVVRSGLIKGATGGREDAKPISVPSGSYVIPADCVSHAGGGNTEAGAAAFKKMLPQAKAGAYASGGTTPTPIRISDGEIVVSPDQVAALGGGDINLGHQKLDDLVKRIRADHIRTLSSLPGPQR